jgi:hypothetical protein
LGDQSEQYAEALNIARNVYMAYQKQNSTHEIESHLRPLLQKFSSAFSVIGQSMLVTGKYTEAVKFIPLAVRSCKDAKEQTELMVQLLQVHFNT